MAESRLQFVHVRDCIRVVKIKHYIRTTHMKMTYYLIDQIENILYRKSQKTIAYMDLL